MKKLIIAVAALAAVAGGIVAAQAAFADIPGCVPLQPCKKNGGGGGGAG